MKSAAERGLAAIFHTFCRKTSTSSLSVVDECGYALLHHASIHNRVPIICQLIKSHLNINQRRNVHFNQGKIWCICPESIIVGSHVPCHFHDQRGAETLWWGSHGRREYQYSGMFLLLKPCKSLSAGISQGSKSVKWEAGSWGDHLFCISFSPHQNPWTTAVQMIAGWIHINSLVYGFYTFFGHFWTSAVGGAHMAALFLLSRYPEVPCGGIQERLFHVDGLCI